MRCAVTVNEVEALYELFKRVSNSLVEDGLIHKEEFCLALFNNANRENLFANRVRAARHCAVRARSSWHAARMGLKKPCCGGAVSPRPRRASVLTRPRTRGQVFEIFDEKKNNVIEFGEFVHALSVFHPKAPLAEKAECAPARFPEPLRTRAWLPDARAVRPRGSRVPNLRLGPHRRHRPQ